MSKRQIKSQASSSRAAFGAFGAGGFGTSNAFGATQSPLSYVSEPPDLSSISDPNVVVHFKNVSKKDSTTKARALEELQTHITSSTEPVEEGIIEAWIKIFPRTTIDNSRRVRQLAYTLHGHIAAAAGKRLAKYMPKAIGAWLCGLQDGDRGVAKAAQESLQQIFNTPEKLANIRRAYQQPILEYCRDAINKETALTLSDERTVSPDDAEAKYSRVISACIAVVASLLTGLKEDDLEKHRAEYEGLLSDAKLLTFASHSDPSIRRALHRFLKVALSKQSEAVEANLDTISKLYLATALNSDQTGSSYDYVDILVLLTTKYPSVWTTNYQSKTSVAKRLRQFIKRGSQSGPREFWNRLTELFKVIPNDILPTGSADVAELLNSLHGGIVRKDELRLNLPIAFNAYLDITNIVCQALVETEAQKVLEELVLPIISQYIKPSPEESDWSLPPNPGPIISKILSVNSMPSILATHWSRYSDRYIADIKASSPEQSKDYDRSQKALIQQATRLATLQEEASRNDTLAILETAFHISTLQIIKTSLEVLKSRNGKPYGAAGTVAEFLRLNKKFVISNRESEQEMANFVQSGLPSLILSPSYTYLIDILYSLSNLSIFEEAWKESLKTILNAPDSTIKLTALEALLSSRLIPSSFDLAAADPELQHYIKKRVSAALEGAADWDSIGRVLQHSSKTMVHTTADEILSNMTESLSITERTSYALQGFRQIVKQNPSLLKSFLATSSGSELLHGLLLNSESSDEEVSQQAVALNASIQAIMASGTESKQLTYDVLHHGLFDVSKTSVSVEALVNLAQQLLKSDDSQQNIEGILPKLESWNATLVPFLSLPPRASLATTNPLGGTVYLVESQTSRPNTMKFHHDSEGFSGAFRVAQYIIKLSKTDGILSNASDDFKQNLLRNISLTLQLAGDNLGLASANDLWAVYTPEVEAEAIEFMSDARYLLTSLLKEVSDVNSTIQSWTGKFLDHGDQNLTAESYYSSRSYSELISDLIEIHGWSKSNTGEMQNALKDLRRSKNIIHLVGFLKAFEDPLAASKSCERMCNEIVADLTGLNLEQKSEHALQQLVILNTILYGQEDVSHSIAKQRLIFFVKHVVPWLHDLNVRLPIRAEACRALLVLLPLMSDIYGSHWGETLDSLAESWTRTKELEENESGMDSPIPYIHSSLKLYAILRSLTQSEDPNDDLIDAWTESEEPIAKGLFNLLKHSQHFPDDFHQPLKIVNEVLARQVTKVPLKHLDSTEELYQLLYVESQPVQQTAFDILHKHIPVAQEQISIDAALEKTTARLPEELLSLILEAPTTAALAEANFERSMPLPLRGYLLSWLLVYDHLEHASYKVKSDYINHIKDGDYLPGLLDFIFSFLGHAQGKPLDVSKLDITTYTPDLEPPKRDTQWLLAHLYFLALQHVPSLTKYWWIDCKSRAIAVSVEPWTEKYISPPVISAALSSVSSWAESLDTTADFTIKISPRAREITASYLVDEQTMTIRISLPPSFPLANAVVEGLSRVAVDERKWQSWLRTSQGAITFSNGNLVDGVMVFKRNAEGALKGQTECAICYSIVGSDKKIPDKRCSTCKNLFHGGCLFKWFKSSSSSSCPLCRNAFNYG